MKFHLNHIVHKKEDGHKMIEMKRYFINEIPFQWTRYLSNTVWNKGKSFYFGLGGLYSPHAASLS